MKTVTWASVSLAIILVPILTIHGAGHVLSPKARPAARVQAHVNESNVDLREHVDDVFELADARSREGKVDEVKEKMPEERYKRFLDELGFTEGSLKSH